MCRVPPAIDIAHPVDVEEIVVDVRPSVVVSVLDKLIEFEVKVLSGQRLVRRTEDVVRLNSIGPRNGCGYSVPRSRTLTLDSSRLACRLAHQSSKKKKTEDGSKKGAK